MASHKYHYNTSIYKEPGLKLSTETPFESMMERFRFTAEVLDLDEGMFQYLSSPVKQVIVSIPIIMDDMEMCCSYHSIWGAKGGVRCNPKELSNTDLNASLVDTPQTC